MSEQAVMRQLYSKHVLTMHYTSIQMSYISMHFGRISAQLYNNSGFLGLIECVFAILFIYFGL